MKQLLRALTLGACLMMLSVTALPVKADVTTTDLQVIARALSFVERPLSGTVNVGIVHIPGNPASLREARAIQTAMGRSLRVGNLTMQPVLVPLENAASANVDLFLLSDHAGPAAKVLPEIAESRRMPCVTLDIVQVRDGTCAIGIRSRPRVEIFVNRAAATSSGVTFATAFRMMITEL
jgi:hypothetical protein